MIADKLIDELRQGEIFNETSNNKALKKLYLESYGCAMNFSDSEIVASILQKEGFSITNNIKDTDLILINTCSIRDKAEQTVKARLRGFRKLKKNKPNLIIGVLGCMAERLKSSLLEQEKLVDLVVGPDAYRDIPKLIEDVEGGQKSVNVLLSREETYADITPVRLASNGVSAFISIMRGCDNMCSFCVVPFTRGRERSRNPLTIVAEAKDLFNKGYKEVTLLGQNVDSYRWNISKNNKVINEDVSHINFAQLLALVAEALPGLRIRFSTSHPKDMTDEVFHTMAKHDNICKYIHLPVQSGSDKMLKDMNRGYTNKWYLNRIDAIHNILPGCSISTDIITGFCNETDEDHKATLALMSKVKFDFAYMFYYSERPGTYAERKLSDNVELEIKKKRLSEVIELQHNHSLESNKKALGNTYKVLIEKVSKKSVEKLCGRNSQNSMIVFDKGNNKIGDYVDVVVEDCTSATLIGRVIKSNQQLKK